MAELIDYVEEPTETTSAATYTSKVLATDADPDAPRCIIVSGAIGGDNTTLDADVRIRDGGGATISSLLFDLSSTGERHGLSWMGYYGFPPGDVQFRRLNHTSGNALLKQCSITTLLMGPYDYGVRATGSPESFSSTLYADYDSAELTIQPNAVGDYLIIAFARLNSGNTNGGRIRLTRTGIAVIAEHKIGARTANDILPWAVVRRVSGLTAATTIKIEARAETDGNAITIDEASIVALYIPTLAGVYYGESTGATTPGSTYLTKATASGMPKALDHVLLGCVHTESDGAASSHNAQLLSSDTETLLECSYTNTVTDFVRPTLGAYVRTLTRGSKSMKTQIRDSGGASPCTGRNSACAIIDAREIGPHTVHLKGKYQLLGKAQVL